MISDVTGVLLAGGKSRRMGEDKRFALVGQRTLFERSCAVLCELFEQVCVVIAQDSPSLEAAVPVVRDLIPDCGSLGGLYTGLRLAKTQHVFLAACDMPFLNPDVIRYLVHLKDQADIVISRWASRLQPTHAVYGRGCLPVLEDMMKLHNRKIQSIIDHPALRVRVIPETEIRQIDHDGCSMFNINTPADLERARAVHNAGMGSVS
ncbi:MAG: molybdenum cofactor guanylyltransferase [Nitrospira sp. LK70]|nr:molybdenum cofactor guanylyltransferase [Nitrospira sp. LK70]